MIKNIKGIFLALAVVFISASATESIFTSSAIISNNNFVITNEAVPVCPSAPGADFCSAGEELVLTGVDASGCAIYSCKSSLGKILINEVYYDVNFPLMGLATDDEWIELYNAGNSAISLKDWSITDNSNTRVINSNKSIPASGYALISKNHSTWSLYWSVPAGIEIIELGSAIGGGLSNTGDRVILKDNNGAVIDQMSYGSDTTVFNPACPDVAKGRSLGRSVLGADNDLAADFIEIVAPSPGGPNV